MTATIGDYYDNARLKLHEAYLEFEKADQDASEAVQSGNKERMSEAFDALAKAKRRYEDAGYVGD